MDELTTLATRFLVLAVAIFAVAALLILLAGWRGGPAVARRLWTVYLTEFGILAAVLVPGYVGADALFVVVAAICGRAAWELYRVLGLTAEPPLPALGVLGGVAIVAGAAVGTEALLFPVLVVAASVTLAAGLVARTSHAAGMHPAALTLVGLVYPSAFGAYILLLGRGEGGFGLLVFLVALVELNDSAAMLGGMLIGGPKIWPRLSPNKTVAGSCAGLLAAVGGAVALGFAVPTLGLPQLLGAGLLIGLAGQAGDLVGSVIKRAAGVKDFATLVPAQGGILDIYDALIFTAPLFWLYLQVVGGM